MPKLASPQWASPQLSQRASPLIGARRPEPAALQPPSLGTISRTFNSSKTRKREVIPVRGQSLDPRAVADKLKVFLLLGKIKIWKVI